MIVKTKKSLIILIMYSASAIGMEKDINTFWVANNSDHPIMFVWKTHEKDSCIGVPIGKQVEIRATISTIQDCFILAKDKKQTYVTQNMTQVVKKDIGPERRLLLYSADNHISIHEYIIGKQELVPRILSSLREQPQLNKNPVVWIENNPSSTIIDTLLNIVTQEGRRGTAIEPVLTRGHRLLIGNINSTTIKLNRSGTAKMDDVYPEGSYDISTTQTNKDIFISIFYNAIIENGTTKFEFLSLKMNQDRKILTGDMPGSIMEEIPGKIKQIKSEQKPIKLKRKKIFWIESTRKDQLLQNKKQPLVWIQEEVGEPDYRIKANYETEDELIVTVQRSELLQNYYYLCGPLDNINKDTLTIEVHNHPKIRIEDQLLFAFNEKAEHPNQDCVVILKKDGSIAIEWKSRDEITAIANTKQSQIIQKEQGQSAAQSIEQKTEEPSPTETSILETIWNWLASWFSMDRWREWLNG